MLVKFNDFDPVEDKYMAISLNYRGDVKGKEANTTVQWLKNNNYEYLIVTGRDANKFGQEVIQEKLNEIVNGGAGRPVVQVDGGIVIQIL